MMKMLFSILGPISIGAIIIAIIKHYDNVKKILSDIISFFAATFGWFKGKSTQMSVETSCQQTINKINSVVPELGMPDLSLKWVKKSDDGHVILEKGKAIVLLKYDKDNSQNIINTTSLYVKRTLLPVSKQFMDDGLKKAIDFAVIRSFLSNCENSNYLIAQHLEKNKEDIHNNNQTFDKISRIEKEGLFRRILLRECSLWGNKVATEIPNEKHREESIKLLDFVYNIASREYDELTPLTCISENVKVGILLVAKYETYFENGIYPYVRRIKEGFSRGITTFYLLARNEKIDILNNVYSELILSGNYELQNGPKIYKDEFGRDNICYCIEIKKNCDFAIAYSEVNEAINNGSPIELNIISVYSDNLRGEYKGIEVIIPRNEISDILDLKLKNYYASGMTIQAIPLSLENQGKIKASLLSTKSEPKSLVGNKFEINGQVAAIVEYSDDEFIRLRVKNTNQEAIAFRRDLTYSRFCLLHESFPIGTELECIIKDIDYVSNKLILQICSLEDPWKNIPYQKGNNIKCTIFNVRDTFFETELPGDYYAILPYSELTWIDTRINEIKKTIKRNSIQSVRIKKVDATGKIIILTKKSVISDYQYYFESLKDKNYETQCVINEITSCGLIGTVNNDLKLFIPLSECHIGDSYFDYKIRKTYAVQIKEVSEDQKSLIGSFKPFITSPLQSFSEKYQVGDIFTNLKLVGKFNSGVSFLIKYSKNKETRAVLFNSDISDLCFVTDINMLFEKQFSCPLCIKAIDKEKNRVILSLKNILLKNRIKINNIELGNTVYGRVIGNKNGKYVVIIEGIYADAYCESEEKLNVGDRIGMIKASSSMFCKND